MKLRGILLALLLGGFAPNGLCADVGAAIDELIPQLGATNVSDRYAAQMELQAMAVKSARPGAKAERAEMARVLAAKATDANVSQPARVWFVRQLEYIGGPEAVTSLTLLLNGRDAELRECARRALEKNPAPAAGEVLRTALEQGGDASWKTGLIQSLGQRGDAKAVTLIKSYLGDQQMGVPAAWALAKIAHGDSVKALWEASDKGSMVAREALILAGAQLAQAGERARAERIFAQLYLAGTGMGADAKDSGAGMRVHCAALVGLAKANPKMARKYIPTDLQSADQRLQYAALTAAGIAYGKDKLADELAPLLPKLSATAKVFVLRQMDSRAEPQVIALTEDPDANVRMTAFETLGRIGGVATVPILFRAAVISSEVQKTAVTALGRISGPGVDVAIEKMADQGGAESRAVAIRALAARDDTRALPALLKYAADPDRKISEAAFFALGQIGTDNELEPLARFAVEGKSPGSDTAMQGVVSRLRDKNAAARKLVAMVPAVDPQQAGLLFETLTVLGGSEALATITNAVSSSNEQTRDAGIRALASWPDFVATEPLLVIAADPNEKRVHQVLAIQGVVRLVKISDEEPAEARLAAALRAMSVATRDEDKKLVLSALASVPDIKAAEAIKSYLNDPKFEPEAGLAGVALADSLRKVDKKAAKSLAQAVIDANVSPEVTQKADVVLNKK